MTDNPTRPAGRWGYQIVGSFTDLRPADRFRPIHSVPPAMQYLYGSVYTEDGRYFWPIHGFYQDRGRFLHLSESVRGEDFVYAPEGDTVYNGPMERGERDGWWGYRHPETGVPVYETDGDTVRWSEEHELLTVTGEAFGRALQFFVPDEEDPLIYTSQALRITEGHVKGSKATGWFFHDTMHMKEGSNYIVSPYLKRIQGAWVAFVTEFEDGNVHMGHLVWGVEGFQLAIIDRTDGPSIVHREVDVAVHLDDTGYPDHVTYTTSRGEVWIWEAAPGGRTPIRTDISPDHRWREGVVRRQGDDRPVAVAEALMEVYNDRVPLT